MENCDHIEGLAREQEDISIKLQNASFVLGLVTDYQHIYDKLVLIDGALQKNDLPSSVTSIVEVKALLDHQSVPPSRLYSVYYRVSMELFRVGVACVHEV